MRLQFFLVFEASDHGVPIPTTTMYTVRVQIIDFNEPPVSCALIVAQTQWQVLDF